jgi:hypothetical protein
MNFNRRTDNPLGDFIVPLDIHPTIPDQIYL